MAGFIIIIMFMILFLCLFLSQPSSALPLCTDLRSPLNIKEPLEFCPYNERSCCDTSKDADLAKQFHAMNVSDSACASLLKSLLCAKCDPFAAELYKVNTGKDRQQRTVPLLCNSTNTQGSHSSKQSEISFCSILWNKCNQVHILHSPFSPSLQGGPKGSSSPIISNSSTLADLWESEATFCSVFGGPSSDNSICFNGEPIKLNHSSETDEPPKGVCLEKIGNDGYINMVRHPDGSNRAFLSNQPGKIWLATIPEQDSGEKLDLDESDPFVDLSDQVLFDTVFGMMGMAFHPDFANNGRFFASYNCDRIKSPACAGRCACNSDVNCDPSKINITGAKSTPCQYQTVIAEFSANGTESNISLADSAKPGEVRRIFTMGLPFTNNHGGQILFGPEDGYLYFMMGDGGGKGDPYGFAQNKKSILGKVLRLDVDNIPSEKEIDDLGLWGHYSIPRDNPYSEDKEMAPEVWAMGFRNPWRCSFDADRPSYLVCGDVGQDKYEEVDIVTKGGNFGWGTYEGPIQTNPTKQSATNESLTAGSLILPVSGYTHEQVNKKIGSAAISGGFFYRSDTDPCMSGRYLYGDLYANNLWTANEDPKNSGNFTTSAIPFSCAKDSPIQCGSVPGSSMPALEYIYSFGQDNRKDIFILASSGVYRVVRPSRCGYACSKESVSPVKNPSPSPNTSPSSEAPFVEPHKNLLALVVGILFVKWINN